MAAVFLRKNKRVKGMLRVKLVVLLFACLSHFFGQQVLGSDLKMVIRLSGYWKFSVGDDLSWSRPEFNDNNWDRVYLPAEWEKNGYEGYNGYAWYRKVFDAYSLPGESPIFLNLGKIDDVDEVYMNGHLIGSTGTFPPNYRQAHNVERKYQVPKDLIYTNKPNIIAVRVYDGWGPGGIRSGNIGISIDADYSLIDLPLEGKWAFMTGSRREWRDLGYDDSKWETITVPSTWESQGYNDYDGYATYRRSFIMPQKLNGLPKYLSLGKVDDIDEVYFNGEFIGTVYDLMARNDFRRYGMEYSIKRIYHIPEHLIQYGRKNVITVVVYDQQGLGGIYEGPVGIMTSNNFQRYRNKHYEPETLWDVLYKWLME
jgi:hypothetical protein